MSLRPRREVALLCSPSSLSKVAPAALINSEVFKKAARRLLWRRAGRLREELCNCQAPVITWKYAAPSAFIARIVKRGNLNIKVTHVLHRGSAGVIDTAVASLPRRSQQFQSSPDMLLPAQPRSLPEKVAKRGGGKGTGRQTEGNSPRGGPAPGFSWASLSPAVERKCFGADKVWLTNSPAAESSGVYDKTSKKITTQFAWYYSSSGALP